ncbi:MAG: UDP-3-O-(3-hydroxymyristoyl)glucosamine N-acyltransferase [Proteobacteria bacterium]|nr:UDP-3-O-(3-hydroxymyristoyl)glucosamine N-acyltransferase [Pseudomonadota bacterium]
MKLSDIAECIGGILHGDGSVEISAVASLEDATCGSISLLASKKHTDKLLQSKASAFILPAGLSCEKAPFISCENPMVAFAKVIRLFHPLPSPKGIDEDAVIEKDVKSGQDMTIYANAFVGEGAILGDRVSLYPGVYVGAGVTIGDDTILCPNVVINDGSEVGKRVVINAGTIVGGEGYGFVWDGTKHLKIPQVGKVVIGDDVEIGANCAIDRATLGKTEIKKGTKIDNFVHIAHNCTVGENTLIVAQTGLSGSVEIGNNVILSGQIAVSDHLKIGDGAIVAGKSGVTKNIEAGAKVGGFPTRPIMEWKRIQKSLEKLPEIRKTVDSLCKKIQKIEDEESNNA